MAPERVPPTSFSGTGHGPIHRLVRTLSGKHSTQPKSPIISPGQLPPSLESESGPSTPTLVHSTSETPPAEPTANSGPSTPTQKAFFAGVVTRFKNINLGLNKDDASDTEATGNFAQETSEPGSSSGTTDPPEPTFLARKIQALIDALPLPTGPTPIPSTPAPKPKRDAAGRPIPPPGASPLRDARLVALLSSATVMNGRPGSRPSVWSVLESMGAPRHDGEQGEEQRRGGADDDVEEGGDGDSYSDGSSVMMYSPLLPSTTSLVELADIEFVVPPPHGEEGEINPGEESSALTAWMTMWPFSSVWGAAGAKSAEPVRRTSLGQRVWVPSTTKLSLQAMWWGYRL